MNEAELASDRRRILLVEDEPGLQEALALVLESEGFDVTRANDGREALESLSRSHPDLIVTDYMMPHLNGVDMIRRIRANPKHAGIPVLLMSAALPESALQKLADAALQKPASISLFISVINRLLHPV